MTDWTPDPEHVRQWMDKLGASEEEVVAGLTAAHQANAARVVYGVRCTWWDSIDKVATTDSGLPVCPHCGSPLFESPDLATWWQAVDRYEAEEQPGYRAMMEWARGRCFPSLTALATMYRTGGGQSGG